MKTEDIQNGWNVDHLIQQQQLDFMIQRVEELYKSDKKILFHLKNAKQFLKNDDADMAVITLENILLGGNVTPEKKEQHNQIIREAKDLGEKFVNQEIEFRGDHKVNTST